MLIGCGYNKYLYAKLFFHIHVMMLSTHYVHVIQRDRDANIGKREVMKPLPCCLSPRSLFSASIPLLSLCFTAILSIYDDGKGLVNTW